MAAATKPAKPKRQSLVSRMDTEAEALLGANKDASLETRLAIFGQIARWVQVRNRLTEVDEHSGLLDAYRRTIDGAQSAIAEREATRIKAANWDSSAGYGVGKVRHYTGRNQRAAKGGTGRDNGGPALEALKSRLPGADDGDADGDRGGGGGESVIIRGSNRVVRSELPGNVRTEFDEDHSVDEF